MFSTETYFLSKTRRTNRPRDWKNFYTSQCKYKIALREAQTQKLEKVLRCRKSLKRGLVHMPHTFYDISRRNDGALASETFSRVDYCEQDRSNWPWYCEKGGDQRKSSLVHHTLSSYQRRHMPGTGTLAPFLIRIFRACLHCEGIVLFISKVGRPD